MPPIPKRWTVQEPVSRRQLNRLSGLHPLLVQILANRGVIESDEVDAFLAGRARFDDPFALAGGEEAVGRIRTAIRAGERVVVYGDFDADGVTATVLLVQALGALGARVEHYIPHRVDEGYGLNRGALEGIAGRGARLVITVDCGIRSSDDVAFGNEQGLDMIVTDHHSIGRDLDGRQVLPQACAVINPRQDGDSYPCKDLTGVGLAFKLAQALMIAEKREPIARGPVTLGESDLLDLVALGTVADLAPLLGENRALVQRGLRTLNEAKRPGIRAMLHESGLVPGRVDATAIGFVLAPRLNAAGRLKSADLSFRLLMASDIEQAWELAAELGRLNQERQRKTAEMVALAERQIEVDPPCHPLYFVTAPDFLPGIVGLVAGRLADELYRPALIAHQGEHETVGSARSIPEFDITGALDECRDLLVRHGGHSAAAGFTVKNERVGLLKQRLEAIATRQLGGLELAPALAIDAVVGLSELDFALHHLLEQLEPCGSGNPSPLLATFGLPVVSSRTVGTDRRHLKLTVRDPDSGEIMDAIAFRQGEWFDRHGPRVDIAYTLEVNSYNGEHRLQLNVKDLRPAT